MPRQIVPSTTSTVAISDSVDLTAAPIQLGLVRNFQDFIPLINSSHKIIATKVQITVMMYKVNIDFIFNINRA